MDSPHVEGDIRDRELLSEVFQGADEVYHLAGVLGTSELFGTVQEAVDINVRGTVNAFDAATSCDVPRLFYPAKPNEWLNAYSITKYAAEQFGRMFNELGATRICSLRYFNAYGPGQALMPVRKIVPAFALRALRGLPIEVYGDGSQIVDMTYSFDLASLSIAFTRLGHTVSVPDCGTGIRVTVNEVARHINEYFGNTRPISYLPMRAGEPPRSAVVAEPAELSSILDYEVSPYESSLASTLDWYAKLDDTVIDKALAFYGEA